MPVTRSRARQFCQAVSDEAGGRVGRWVDIAAVGERLGLGLDRAIVLAEDCELAGFVTHDRSYFAQPKRGRELPHSVTPETLQERRRCPRLQVRSHAPPGKVQGIAVGARSTQAATPSTA